MGMGNRPDLGSGKGTLVDQKRTNCVICKFGIFEGQPSVRVRRPFLLGSAHPECLASLEAGK